MHRETFKILIEKYLDESINSEEKLHLSGMLQDPAYLKFLDEIVIDQLSNHTYELEPGLAIQQSIDQYLDQKTLTIGLITSDHRNRIVHRAHFLKTAWFRYAAVIILILGTGSYFYFQNEKKPALVSVNPASLKNDIAPGTEGAILTLSDGSNIVLDSLRNGVVATQNGADVIMKNGQIAYKGITTASVEMVYNTMTTRKGRQFQMMLPDGTKVWLNAASSIRYPTVFIGSERKVEVTGEAYFDVVKDAKKPFRVQINAETTVEVLGTQFNINSYENESAIKTTLLEGSIQVNSNNQHKILKPNEEAIISGTSLKVNEVDINEVVAWKNGFFNFNGSNLFTVMRQLERWYDIQVKFEGKINGDENFRGELQRSLNLSQVIKSLEDLNVKCRIEGKTLIVE